MKYGKEKFCGCLPIDFIDLLGRVDSVMLSPK